MFRCKKQKGGQNSVLSTVIFLFLQFIIWLRESSSPTIHIMSPFLKI